MGVITKCGTTISGASVRYIKPDTTTTTAAMNNSTGIITCSDVQLQFPLFQCDNGCSQTGEVGIQVNWTSYGTSGIVTIDAGGLGGATLPAVFGSAVVVIPANGELITVTVCDAENPLCCDSFLLQLPDCN